MMIFQKNRYKLIEKAWDFEKDIIIEQIFEHARKSYIFNESIYIKKSIYIYKIGPKKCPKLSYSVNSNL